MGKKNINNNIRYAFSLALAGGAIYFNDNLNYARILLVASVSLIVIPILFKLFLKYILSEILSYFSSKNMKIHYDGNKEYAKETYKIAQKNGGTIISTHILQHRVKPQQDFAYQVFKDGIEKKIDFRRVLIFSNKQEEKEWLETFRSIQDSNLDFTAYLWKYVDFMHKKPMYGLIPKFNFLLYKDLKEENFRILVGFERVRSRRNYLVKNLNFGISFSTKLVYEALLRYFNNITEHPEIYCIEKDENKTSKDGLFQPYDDYILSPQEQFIIKDLIDLAYTSENVKHLGAFGKTAILLKNLSKIKKKVNHQSDIDLLFIINGDKQGFKELIEERTKKYEFDTEIIFGDDDEYFYGFRNKNITLVDIEIFEVESNYYKSNQLLGYSIFHHYYNLFTVNNKTVDQLIHIPSYPIPITKRKKLFLDNRKSIAEFIDKIENQNNSTIDPRRVLTINIINLNWVLTGFRCSDVETALNYLVLNKFLNQEEMSFITELLDSDQQMVKKDYKVICNESLRILIKMKNIVFQLNN